jgi:hypothetical protein
VELDVVFVEVVFVSVLADTKGRLEVEVLADTEGLLEVADG